MENNPEFVRVCSFAEVPRNRGRTVMLDPWTEVAIFNIDGEILAVDNVCPHQHAPVIADGHVENCTVRCPLHGYTYNLRSGVVVDGVGKALRIFAVVCDGDDVLVRKPPMRRPRWMGGEAG